MAKVSDLKKDFHRADLKRTDKLLLALTLDNNKPKPVTEIRRILLSGGLSQAKNWSISAMLHQTRGLAIRVEGGWELSPQGLDHVRGISTAVSATPTTVASQALTRHVVAIKNADTRVFVGEAITCLDLQLFRAAVVLSWVGAVAVLYDHVVAHHLAAFNAEALRRDAKWKQAKTGDDLARLKEHDFLEILEGISVIGKSVKQALQQCLQRRNACGHPNSYVIGENTVASHIEQLIDNVFTKF